MLTRRTALTGGMVLAMTGTAHRVIAKASQPATPVNFEVPANACDCHTHIHGDVAQFPFFSGRVYTPEMALPEEMSALHGKLGIKRVVIVTPSVYGADNSATLYGMKARGADARGVAVIDDKTSEQDLDAMHQAGIRGVRLNLTTGGINDPVVGRQRFEAAVNRIKGRNWHIQIYTNLTMISAVKDLVLASPLLVVFDHFGGARATLGVDQPGFGDLLELVRAGKAYVKVSAPYRSSSQAPDFADVAPLAKALIATNADRVVWGTDWPHPDSTTPAGKKTTDVTPLFQIDDGLLLSQLPTSEWSGPSSSRRAPARAL